MSCSAQGVTYGFSFHWNLTNDVFVPRTISRTGASSAIDCVSEYGQLQDGSWYLPLSDNTGTNTINGVGSFAECVGRCDVEPRCQFVTYDYQDRTCTLRNGAEVVYEG